MGCGTSIHVSQSASPERKTSVSANHVIETKSVDTASSQTANTDEKQDMFTVNPDPHENFMPTSYPSALELKCRSAIEKIAPRHSEEPARKEIEELIQHWREGGQLADIESYSLNAPPSRCTSITELSEYLTSSNSSYIRAIEGNILHLQVAKAYCIYSWIANNITYDNQLWQTYQSTGDSTSLERNTRPDEVLERRTTVSNGYANLFKSLAGKSGLKVEVIQGNTKEWWKSQSVLSPEYDFKLSSLNSHAWNSITIGGIAYLVDCTLGSGYISPNVEYMKEFTPHFFAVRPQDLILTHWPSRANQQLLKKPIAFSEFQPLIPLSSRAIGLGFYPDTWSELLEIPEGTSDPVVTIQITCKSGVKILAKLSSKQELEDSNKLSNCVLIYRDVKNNKRELKNVRIRAVIPNAGWYVLDIYAYSSLSNASYENCRAALSYQIQSTTIAESESYIGYPTVYDLAATAFDFQILHWNKPMPDYCCKNTTGELDIVFRAKPDLQFYHYIVSGTVDCEKADSVHHYNTLVAQNECGDPGLYLLRCVFPSEGFWSVYLCATKTIDSESQQPTVSGYTSVLRYHVYVKDGIINKSFPHIIAPYISLKTPDVISASGNDILNVQFNSSRVLDFHSYLTYEVPTSEPLECYSTVFDSAKSTQTETPNVQHQYSLDVIFPRPGKWYVHLFGREFAESERKYAELFILCVVVEGALSDHWFPKINVPVANSFKYSCYDTGCIKFCDDGSPFTFKFKASGSGIRLLPSIMLADNQHESSVYEDKLQQCTLLYPSKAHDGNSCVYTMNAIFPSAGTWSVQLFGSTSDSNLDDYKLVFYIQIQVNNPMPNMCYPTLYPAFYNLGLSIPNEFLLYNYENVSSEAVFPFHSPGNVVFDARLVQCDKVFVNQAILKYVGSPTSDDSSSTQNRKLHIVFPKPGEWIVYLYAGSWSTTLGDSHPETKTYFDKEAVLELKFKALCCNDQLAFPQIFDPFYSMFALKLDEEQYPLLARVNHFPSTITLPFYSPSDVKFWHCGKLLPSSGTTPVTRMQSDSLTGLCTLSMEISERGQWTLTLSAQKSDSPDNEEWITVLEHTIQAI